MKVAFLFLLSLLASCASIEEQQPGPSTEDGGGEEVQPEKAGACAKTQILLREGAKWTAEDDRVLKGAARRCGQLYTKSPCVSKFTKLGDQDNIRYRVICGKPG